MVSVIMPAYNAEITCEKSIKSVLNQTYKNFELLVVNDGSKDKTEEKCKKIAEEFQNVKVITQRNQGVSAARNTGLMNAEGKYIAFIDSDDEYKETFLEKMVKAAEAESADMVICGFSDAIANDEHILFNPKICESKKDYGKHLLEKVNGTSGLNPPWNKLYLREKILFNFNTQKQMGEDLEFVCKFIANADKITSISESLYKYNTDVKNSLTSNLNLKLKAIPQDMLVLHEFTESIGISSSTVKNKFYDRIEGILKPLNKKKCLDALNILFNDEEFLKLLEWRPDRYKNRFIHFCLVHRYNNILFCFFVIKRTIKNFL